MCLKGFVCRFVEGKRQKRWFYYVSKGPHIDWDRFVMPKGEKAFQKIWDGAAPKGTRGSSAKGIVSPPLEIQDQLPARSAAARTSDAASLDAEQGQPKRARTRAAATAAPPASAPQIPDSVSPTAPQTSTVVASVPPARSALGPGLHQVPPQVSGLVPLQTNASTTATTGQQASGSDAELTPAPPSGQDAVSQEFQTPREAGAMPQVMESEEPSQAMTRKEQERHERARAAALSHRSLDNKRSRDVLGIKEGEDLEEVLLERIQKLQEFVGGKIALEEILTDDVPDDCPIQLKPSQVVYFYTKARYLSKYYKVILKEYDYGKCSFERCAKDVINYFKDEDGFAWVKSPRSLAKWQRKFAALNCRFTHPLAHWEKSRPTLFRLFPEGMEIADRDIAKMLQDQKLNCATAQSYFRNDFFPKLD